MEIDGTMKRFFIFMLILLAETSVWSQNYYKNSAVYYNMDTTKSVLKSRNFYDYFGIDILSDTLPVIDLDSLFNVYQTTLTVPVLSIRNQHVNEVVENTLQEALSNKSFKDFLLPDTSGYFVRMLFESFSDIKPDSMRIITTPSSNYYMAISLVSYDRYESYNYKIRGCFYHDSILCVVMTCCGVKESDYNCLWEETGSLQTIKIYKKEFGFSYYRTSYDPTSFSYIRKCE